MTWPYAIDWPATAALAVALPWPVAAVLALSTTRARMRTFPILAAPQIQLYLVGASIFASVVVLIVVSERSDGGWFGQSTAAWVQAIGSVAAILAAVWVATQEGRRQRLKDHSADVAFATSAVVAAEYAEVALSQAQKDLGGRGDTSRDAAAISPSLHFLEAAEAALNSLALDRAPTVEIARALMSARFHVRAAGGSIRAFLGAPYETAQVDYDEEQREVVRAAMALRAELRRLTES